MLAILMYHAPLSCRRSAGEMLPDHKIKAKVEDISKKDNTSVTQTDLKKGSSLMVAVTGKDLPYRVAGLPLVFVWTVYWVLALFPMY